MLSVGRLPPQSLGNRGRRHGQLSAQFSFSPGVRTGEWLGSRRGGSDATQVSASHDQRWPRLSLVHIDLKPPQPAGGSQTRASFTLDRSVVETVPVRLGPLCSLEFYFS